MNCFYNFDVLPIFKAEIYFIKENLCFTDDTENPFNKLTLQLLGSIAEFERNFGCVVH